MDNDIFQDSEETKVKSNTYISIFILSFSQKILYRLQHLQFKEKAPKNQKFVMSHSLFPIHFWRENLKASKHAV